MFESEITEWTEGQNETTEVHDLYYIIDVAKSHDEESIEECNQQKFNIYNAIKSLNLDGKWTVKVILLLRKTWENAI